MNLLKTLSPTRREPKLAVAKSSARGGSVRGSLAASCLAIALLFCLGFWWFYSDPTEQPLSQEEQNLFKLPGAVVHDSADKSKEGTVSSNSTADAWKLPTEPLEFTTSELQSRCTQVVDQLIKEFPESAEANNMAARVYFFLRQPEKAEPYWRKCLQIGPPLVGYYAGLAMIVEERGQPEEVKSLIEKAHTSGLKSAETHVRYVKALEALGQIETAFDEATKSIENYANSHELWQIHGQLLNQLNRFEEAEKSFRKSLELGGSSERILPALVLSLARQKKQKEAAEVRKQFSAENSPSNQGENREGDYQRYYDSNLRQLALAVYQTSARLFVQNRRKAEYLEALQRCIELEPNDAEAIIALAEVAKSSQRTDEALNLYQRAIQANPKDLNCYMSLSNFAMQLGDKTLAESTLLRAVDLPQGFVAQHSLAQMYMLQGRQAEALKLAEQVVEKDASVEAYLLHCFVCSSMGKLELARISLENARKIAPDDPRIQSMRLPQP